MARQRRDISEQLADLVTRQRNTRTISYKTPAQAPATADMIADDAILSEHLSKGAVKLDNLDEDIQETLASLAGNEVALEEAQARLDEEALRIDYLFENGGGISEEDVEAVVIREAVLKKIAAGTAGFQEADIGNLTVTGTSNLDEAVARTIAADTGRFITLSTDNLVAGDAAIGGAVIDKLYSEVVESRELVADRVKAGAIDGLRVVGASIETNQGPRTGVKLNDKGMVAHGTSTVTEVIKPGAPLAPAVYRNSLTIAELPQNWASVGDTNSGTVPTIQFSGEREDGLSVGPKPLKKAYISASNPPADGVSVGSATLPEGEQISGKPVSKASTVSVDPGNVGLTSGVTRVGGQHSTATLNVMASNGGGASILLSTIDPDKKNASLEVNATYQTVSITAPGGYRINGRDYLPRPWTLIPLQSGRAALDGNKPAVRIDSTGEYYEFTGGFVMMNTVATGPGVVFATLPIGFRPPTYKNFNVATAGGPMGLTIASSGDMYLNPTGLPSTTWIDISQLRFAVNGPR